MKQKTIIFLLSFLSTLSVWATEFSNDLTGGYELDSKKMLVVQASGIYKDMDVVYLSLMNLNPMEIGMVPTYIRFTYVTGNLNWYTDFPIVGIEDSCGSKKYTAQVRLPGPQGRVETEIVLFDHSKRECLDYISSTWKATVSQFGWGHTLVSEMILESDDSLRR